MKKSLFALLLAAAVVGVSQSAQAQDKPVLNTAPPGAPVPSTAPEPVVTPTPVPVPPATQPSPDRPSGLDLPSDRDARAAGAGPSQLSNKLFIYSGFGLGFSSYNDVSQFNFSVSPAIGYRITERLAAGPGISYAYSNFGLPAGYGGDISTSSFGLKAFTQFIVYHEFFLHAEIESTRAEVLDYNLDKRTLTVTSKLAGVGYRSQFSDRAAGDILLLYNFDDTATQFSLYPNPVIRFTFLFNLGR